MARTPPGRTRARVLEFVRRRIESGRPPTLREVQEALGLRAVESARAHLMQLVEEGKLLKDDGVARGWRLPKEQTSRTRHVPVLGRVPAGAVSEAIEEQEGVVPFDLSRLSGTNHELFALRVHGESMRDAGILPGDLVIVDAKAQARHRDVVVARIDGDATVKRLVIAKGRPELHPENPAFDPIVPAPGDDFAILGKVIEVRRHL
jgi:repressor LexA